MDEIKLITGGDDDTIDFSPDMMGDDLNIQLKTPRRKSKPKKRKRVQPPPPPPASTFEDDPTMDAFINPSKKQVDDDELSFGGEAPELDDVSEPYSDDGYQHELPPAPPTQQVESVQPSKGYDTVDNETYLHFKLVHITY